MTDETTARSLAHRLFDLFNSGDIAALSDYLHPDARAEFPFSPPGMPPAFEGREAAMTAFTQGRANFSSMTLTPTKSYWSPADATLVIEATSKATLLHGTDYENAYVLLIGFRDGLVILWREYFNGLIALRAIEGEAAAASVA